MTLPAATKKIEKGTLNFLWWGPAQLINSYFNSLNTLKGLLSQNFVSSLYGYLTEINRFVNIFLI